MLKSMIRRVPCLIWEEMVCSFKSQHCECSMIRCDESLTKYGITSLQQLHRTYATAPFFIFLQSSFNMLIQDETTSALQDQVSKGSYHRKSNCTYAHWRERTDLSLATCKEGESSVTGLLAAGVLWPSFQTCECAESAKYPSVQETNAYRHYKFGSYFAICYMSRPYIFSLFYYTAA